MNKLIAWAEIPVSNIERAISFYNKVFKLSLTLLDFGHEKMALLPNDEGALSQSDGFKPSNNGALLSFSVPDSMEATIKRLQNSGGRVIVPKTKIEAEGRGFFATFIDCEGNKIGLYSPN
ncbi:MAG: hypothetical protein N4A74_07570 [Carboxylicivirga sp.]|jgi:predicted enzyme related to lactoylglutathione lyase|nr:hypothetical protein [Carboxylicivirga sp.]